MLFVKNNANNAEIRLIPLHIIEKILKFFINILLEDKKNIHPTIQEIIVNFLFQDY